MRVNLKVASSSTETGALIKEYLIDRGVYVTDTGSSRTISYGVPYPGALGDTRPAKRGPGFGKIFNMERMNEKGVRTVPWFQGTVIPRGFKFPALARAAHGYGGKDIVPVFQPEEVEWRANAGWDWFSSYIPLAAEYRVWNYRGETLGVYQKVMRRPKDFKFIGRNFRNGFDFEFVKEGLHPYPVVDMARRAVLALQVDFAAVDLIVGKDGLVYILESNTAPGAIKSSAQATLSKLVDRMVSWLENGCPEKDY